MLVANAGVVHNSGLGIEDVQVAQVWDRLKADARALLVDVRTQAEWAFVGVPDLSKLGKRLLTLEWQSFPSNRVDPEFAPRLASVLETSGASQDDEIFFICRSGGRSRMAAEALTALGFRRCRNVADGFEGPLDPSRHRGQTGGWKAAGLPWVQG